MSEPRLIEVSVDVLVNASVAINVRPGTRLTRPMIESAVEEINDALTRWANETTDREDAAAFIAEIVDEDYRTIRGYDRNAGADFAPEIGKTVEILETEETAAA